MDILSEIIKDILKLSIGSFILVKCLTTYRGNVFNMLRRCWWVLGNCLKGSYSSPRSYSGSGSYSSSGSYRGSSSGGYYSSYSGGSSSSSVSWDCEDNSSGGYDAVKDMLDYPRQEGPLYDPYRNQLYDNCRGGWDD